MRYCDRQVREPGTFLGLVGFSPTIACLRQCEKEEDVSEKMNFAKKNPKELWRKNAKLGDKVGLFSKDLELIVELI